MHRCQTVFDDNHALMYGGAVVLTLGSTMHMQDSTMQHNRANDEGEWRRLVLFCQGLRLVCFVRDYDGHLARALGTGT